MFRRNSISDEEKLGRSRQVFDKISGVYGEIRTVEDGTRQEAWRACADDAGCCLEIGCGNGLLLGMLAANPNLRIVGVDFAEKMLCESRARLGVVGERVAFARCVSALLPFPDGAFDCVLCVNVLHNLPSNNYRERTLEELVRVARPGGRLVFDVRSSRNPGNRITTWDHSRTYGHLVNIDVFSPEFMRRICWRLELRPVRRKAIFEKEFPGKMGKEIQRALFGPLAPRIFYVYEKGNSPAPS